jgi:hypothetical protein
MDVNLVRRRPPSERQRPVYERWRAITKRQTVAEHYKWAPHAEATHGLAALQDRAYDVLHEVRKEAAHKEPIRATEDRFGDQHLVIAYRTQPKTRTEILGESLQEFATTTKQLTHHASPALHEDHIRMGIGKAFINSIKQLLLLGSERTVNEAIRQTLVLKIVKLAVGSSIRLRKTTDRALWSSWPPLI